MSERWYEFKTAVKDKWRELIDWWRALPRDRQWKIAGWMLAVSSVCLVVAVYAFFFRNGGKQTAVENTSVVLYSSVDSNILAPVVEAFEQKTGIKVKVVGDTEATKTTGLVARLLSEQKQPRADVWWSSEPLGSITLAEAGVLEPFLSRAESTLEKGWPPYLRDKGKRWYGFAQRARVMAYNTNRLNKTTAPVRLRDLTQPKWNGKVGMARPQFGSTRTFIATLVAQCGEAPVRAWLEGLRDNNLKLYDGNSSVATALSNGEIEVGLTDSDDVWGAKRENMPVEMVYEPVDQPNARITGLPAIGPVVLPNTVGKIASCPHPNEAGKLADFLLSVEVEEMLAQGDSRNIPIHPELVKKYEKLAVPNPAQVDAGEVAKALAAADRLINELLPSQ